MVESSKANSSRLVISSMSWDCPVPRTAPKALERGRSEVGSEVRKVRTALVDATAGLENVRSMCVRVFKWKWRRESDGGGD